MLGIVLFYVGAVLFINSLGMLGKIALRETAIMNIFAGLVSFAICINVAFDQTSIAHIQFCAYGLMFSFTYLWIAYNILTKQDGKGLGWFSLFVSITATAITCDQLLDAKTLWGYWLTLCWALWAVLWFCYFILGVYPSSKLVKPIAILTLTEAIITGWLPGYLLLSGHMPE